MPNGTSYLGSFWFWRRRGSLCSYEALRPDEDSLDATHSVYVDQWDWEKVIPNGQRNLAYLKETVEKIYKAIRLTELAVEARYDIESILTQTDYLYPHRRTGRALSRLDSKRT